MKQTTVYHSLDQAMEALKTTLNDFSDTMKDIRTSLRNDSAERAQRTATANGIFAQHGYMDESESKLEQWGVYDAPTADAAEAIIYEVLEHRRDKAAGNL